MSVRRNIELRELGLVRYREGIALQAELVRRRRADQVSDQLLLLEHPHVITMGTAGTEDHILLPEDARARLGVEVVPAAGRGGDVTYHGPGQLVGYPILDLKPDRTDVHRYLRDLEEVLLRTVRSLGVEAHRAPGRTGVWTERGKVAAIGIRVSSGWITSHGFALNVRPDLSFFGAIIPCGITDAQVTSLEELLGDAPPMEEVIDRVGRSFGEVFEAEVRPGTGPLPAFESQASGSRSR